jgi:hypothetical protein
VEQVVALVLVLEVGAETANLYWAATTENQATVHASAVEVQVSAESDVSVDLVVASVQKASAELLFSAEWDDLTNYRCEASAVLASGLDRALHQFCQLRVSWP